MASVSLLAGTLVVVVIVVVVVPAEVVRREGRIREHVAVVEAPQRARVPPPRAIPAEVEERRVERVPAIEPAAVARLLGDAHGDGRDAAEDVAEAAQEAR